MVAYYDSFQLHSLEKSRRRVLCVWFVVVALSRFVLSKIYLCSVYSSLSLLPCEPPPVCSYVAPPFCHCQLPVWPCLFFSHARLFPEVPPWETLVCVHACACVRVCWWLCVCIGAAHPVKYVRVVEHTSKKGRLPKFCMCNTLGGSSLICLFLGILHSGNV